MKTWAAEGRASGPVWLLYIHQDSFKEMLSAIPSMIERIVFLLVDRNRDFTKAEEQIAKLAALGKLAANIAHELNNPASAARSSVTAYFSQLPRSENLKYQIGRLLQSDEKQLAYSDWIGQFRATAEAYFYTVNALNRIYRTTMKKLGLSGSNLNGWKKLGVLLQHSQKLELG
jgi:signal transduction histidine kinase